MEAVEKVLEKHLNSSNANLRLIAQTFQAIKTRNTGYMDIITNKRRPEYQVYQYAALVSVECERVFSALSNILTDRRQSFKFENLKDYLFVHVNSKFLNLRPVIRRTRNSL